MPERDESQRMIDRSIAAHKRRFSAFGVVTAIVSLVPGIAIVCF